jgi:hypothetical protein
MSSGNAGLTAVACAHSCVLLGVRAGITLVANVFRQTSSMENRDEQQRPQEP